ncbi:MAG: sugar phosphate nucleotidyltransferase [bacterium]
MLYGVIIAGGRGERFWPCSTRKHPKQLIPIASSKPMIVETVNRILPLIPRKKIIVVANKELNPILKKLTPGVKKLLEPFGRNTACAIGYTAINLKENDVMAVLPADHWIPDGREFLNAIEKAVEIANQGWLVTFGITPKRAETGYGYIEVGDEITGSIYKVKNFKEKPNQKEAQEFIHAGRFLWNSGIFVWRVDKILQAFHSCMPELYDDLMKLKRRQISLVQLYNKAQNISIDYGVMEKCQNVAVVKSNFTWDDVGSWTSLERLHSLDKHNNVKLGLHSGIDTKDCIIVSTNGAIATIGVSDLVIVQSDNVVFVCDRNRIDEIKSLVRQIGEDKDFEKYL